MFLNKYSLYFECAFDVLRETALVAMLLVVAFLSCNFPSIPPPPQKKILRRVVEKERFENTIYNHRSRVWVIEFVRES